MAIRFEDIIAGQKRLAQQEKKEHVSAADLREIVKESVIAGPKAKTRESDNAAKMFNVIKEQVKILSKMDKTLLSIQKNLDKANDPMNVSEEEAEATRLQTGIYDVQIEQLDVLKDIQKILMATLDPIKKASEETAKKDSPGFLSDLLTNAAGGMLGGAVAGKVLGGKGVAAAKGGGRLGKIGSAIGTGAKGLAKFAGRMAAPLWGAHEGYVQWSQANEDLESGKITEKEANVQKSGAVGRGLGTWGGAGAGAATGAAIGSVVPVVGTAIGAIIGSIVGGFAGGEFGDMIGQFIGESIDDIKGAINDYIVDPISNMFETIKGAFNDYIAQPVTDAFNSIVGFFSDLKNSVVGFFEGFEIPKIGFTIPIINKEVSIGPFYPFKSATSAASTTSGTSPATPSASNATTPAVAAASTTSGTSPATPSASNATTPAVAAASTTPVAGLTDTAKVSGSGVSQTLSVAPGAIVPGAIVPGGTTIPQATGPETRAQTEKRVRGALNVGVEKAQAEVRQIEEELNYTPEQRKKLAERRAAVNVERAKDPNAAIDRDLASMQKETSALRSEAATNRIESSKPSAASAVYESSGVNAGVALPQVSAPSVVVAPQTSNVVNNNTSTIHKIPSRNNDITLQDYFKSRYA